VSLLLGIAILALSVFLGGLAALFREAGRRVIPAIRTFAVVAAASIALLHLLPEAIAAIGLPALLATVICAFGPAVLERSIPSQRRHRHDAPTTALAMGYAAVIAHQAGEGAALASLAGTGALSPGIVLAIAAHTVPLSMVVAIRVLEVKGGAVRRRATSIALAGVAFATVAGALGGNLVGAARLTAVQPWILASAAGLLLHALSHDALPPPSMSPKARLAEMLAGWGGLVIAVIGIEKGSWFSKVPGEAQISGVAVLAGAIAARSFWPRAHLHDESRDHR
jgi:ZIP family zinc transporter